MSEVSKVDTAIVNGLNRSVPSLAATQEMRYGRRQLSAAIAELGTVPLPACGDTLDRFEALARVGASDLAEARLVEGHLDAVAIWAEADRPPPPGPSGVWAADPPNGRLDATASGSGWRLSGTKRWCSGARALRSALVTAHADDGYRLFEVPLDAPGVHPQAGTWPAVGMASSDTLHVTFDEVVLDSDAAVGGAGWYLGRRGFWIGGIGVAACWYGGADGLRQALREVASRRAEPHRLAALGAVDAACTAMWATLVAAAAAIEEGIAGDDLRLLALRTRSVVERLALDALRDAERGLGAGGLTGDPRIARLIADLPVYVRQHHGAMDLEALGRAVTGTSRRQPGAEAAR